MPRGACRSSRSVAIGTLLRSSALAVAAVALPPPSHDSGHSLERAIAERRSEREFGAGPIGLAQVGQLAWAAQGMAATGRRTVPSAGALYPIEVYVAAGNVEGLAPGIYHYQFARHRLAPLAEGDRRGALAAAARGQGWLEGAAAIFIIAGFEQRTTAKYGERGVRYVQMEAGHAAQNLLLQAVALDLASVPVGAFSDAAVHRAAALPKEARALYLIPVGRPR